MDRNLVLQKLIVRLQQNFLSQLAVVHYRIRQRQLEAARKRAETAKKDWEAHLKKCQEWQAVCNRDICDGCDRYTRYCRCDHPPRASELVEMIRRCAGINSGHSTGECTVHDEDKHGGPAGYRVCSKANWDNTVRAYEESR